MTDNSYGDWNLLSDIALQAEIGNFIKKARQQQGKTQLELANEANISRSTLSLLERGESGNLKTLIQVLRVLQKLSLLQVFEYKEQISPLALAEMQIKYKKRVRHKKTKKDSPNKKSTWQ